VFDACSNRPTRSNTSGECRRVTDTSVLGRDTRPSSDTSVLGKGMRPSTDTSVLGKGMPPSTDTSVLGKGVSVQTIPIIDRLDTGDVLRGVSGFL